MADTRRPRRWTVIDAIAGRILRVTRLDWAELETKKSPRGELVQQAAAAGMLRSRSGPLKNSWSSSLMKVLAFRVRLCSVDSIAKTLAGYSGVLFSPSALLIGSASIVVAVLSVMLGWSRISQSLGTIHLGVLSTGQSAGTYAVMFWLIKCVHELGHAVACRRLGVPVGDVGFFFFCGVPCPYCDVSQVWRIDSRLRRAAVMLAGIYVELVIASLACLVYWIAGDGTLRLWMLQTMVLCGASTVLFNANPLMRLDGYYVLSDALGSTNLRRQASLAWDSLVVSRLMGLTDRRAKLSRVNALLIFYHAASSIYRVMIVIVIATFVVAMLGRWQLWWIGAILVMAIGFASGARFLTGMYKMTKGEGRWRSVHVIRRMSLAITAATVLTAALNVSLDRTASVVGWIDVSDSVTLFVPQDAWVQSAPVEFGDRVHSQETIAIFHDDTLATQLASYHSRSKLAAIESDHLKRKALRQSGNDVAWKLDHAARESIDAQHDLLKERKDRLTLRSPLDGTLLPIVGSHEHATDEPLANRQGQFLHRDLAWCRIGNPNVREVRLEVTAAQRQMIAIGRRVKIFTNHDVVTSFDAVVDGIVEMPAKKTLNTRLFLVTCRLPPCEDADTRYAAIGSVVDAAITIETEPVWKRFRRWVVDVVNAPVPVNG